jgi:casein kinase 1
MYGSINSHMFTELSRRDDLESLGYMLMYFYLGTLSWQDICQFSNNIDTNEKIVFLKNNIIEGNKLPPVLINYMKYVRNLGFEETPNYSFIIENLKNELENISEK